MVLYKRWHLHCTFGYQLACSIQGSSSTLSIQGSYGEPNLKAKIWKLPIFSKVKHFLWRVISKAVGTATRLGIQVSNMDKTCQWCCLEDETITHMFFQCHISISTWRLVNLLLLCVSSPLKDVEENIKSIMDLQTLTRLSEFQKLLFFWIMWRIWKSHNSLIFKKHN